ncbi:hypothetical protein HU200_008788 [Digitaria exilis]|uniref:Uncharacterized protein n=1 Tax=Digitaria exilis TaxID=1010633 RepID=A0A835KNI6_9POAL|nr:hypothetical protein HU200_008788 [Digitaria exilis]
MPHALHRTTEHSTSLLSFVYLSPPQNKSQIHRPSQESKASKHMLPLLMNMQAPPPPSQSCKQQQLMRTVSISVLVMSLPVLYISFLHVPPATLFRDTTFWFLMSNSIIIVIAADSGMLFFRSSSSSDDDDGIPFVVSGAESVAIKSGGLVSSMGEVVVSAISDEVVVQGQALVVSEHGDMAAPAIAAGNDDHAYALVVREHQGERVLSSTPEMIAAGEAVKNVDGGGAIVPARPRTTRLMAAPATRTRRRHGHRSSQSQAIIAVEDKSVVVSEEKHHLRRTATESRPSPSPAAEDMEKESEYSRLSDEELNRRVEEFITKFNREIRLQLEKEQAAVASG